MRSSTGLSRGVLLMFSFVLGLLATAGSSRAQNTPDIQVGVTISRDTIGLDETATLQIVVSGNTQDLPGPKVPTLPMFEVYSQGRSSNFSLVNGRIESSVTYRYLILPKKEGSYPIDNIAVVHQNKRYKGNAVSLTVLDQGTTSTPSLEAKASDKTGQSKDLFLEATVDNANPYVNEQVTLSLKFYIAVQFYGSPSLTGPTTTGFWTEVLRNTAPYHQKVGGRTYRVLERKYALFPTQTGVLQIGRAAITTTVATQSRRRDPFDVFGGIGRGKDVTVRSNPIRVEVKPLPETGRPEGYTGTIGKFSITAQADKTTVEVNQPVTVTINIRGVGNIKSVAEPTIPELDDFRVYRASSSESVSKPKDRIGGTKTFEEVFIPKRAGSLEIPAVHISFFDPEKKRFQTVETRPIKLEATKASGPAAEYEVPYAGPDMTLGAESREIRFIKEDPGELRPVGRILEHSALYVAVNAASVLLLVATVLVRVRREKLAGDVGYARARGASKQARKRLTKAKELARLESAEEFYSESCQVVVSYIADKLNVSPHGLTTDKVSGLLSRRAAAKELIEDTTAFLHNCDFARFAPSTVSQADIDQTLKQAEDIMVRMEGIKF
ncbi:MAG: protein BatD [bacterium]|nr:protein BatD [bacterium]